MVICNNRNLCQSCREFQCELTVLELPEDNKILSEGFECVIHMHSIMEDVRISKICAVRNKEGKMVKTAFLKSDSVGVVHIKAVDDKEFNL